MKTKPLIQLQYSIRSNLRSKVGQSTFQNEVIKREREAMHRTSTVNGFVRLSCSALKTIHKLNNSVTDSMRKINFNNSLLVSLDC